MSNVFVAIQKPVVCQVSVSCGVPVQRHAVAEHSVFGNTMEEEAVLCVCVCVCVCVRVLQHPYSQDHNTVTVLPNAHRTLCGAHVAAPLPL